MIIQDVIVLDKRPWPSARLVSGTSAIFTTHIRINTYIPVAWAAYALIQIPLDFTKESVLWGGSRILWRGVRGGVRTLPERYFWAKVNVQIGIFHTNEWAKGGFDLTPRTPPGSATEYCTVDKNWHASYSNLQLVPPYDSFCLIVGDDSGVWK